MNKTHKLMIYQKVLKNNILKNKQPKLYQSSKNFTTNERARRKKKNEHKIVKNGGEMRENEKDRKMAPFDGCFCAKMRKKVTMWSFYSIVTMVLSEPPSQWIQNYRKNGKK